MQKTWFAVPAAVLALSACERAADPVACPAIVHPSVDVTVQDSATSANLTGGSILVLRDAAGVADSVTAPVLPGPYPLTSMSVGQEQTGTFTLTVRHAGYREWVKSGIKVKRGECGAETVRLTASLQPAS